jgi:hypothetical protein
LLSLEEVDESPHAVTESLRSVSVIFLLEFFLLKRASNESPYLLPDAEPSPYVIGEHLVASSSKLIVIDKFVHLYMVGILLSLIHSISKEFSRTFCQAENGS